MIIKTQDCDETTMERYSYIDHKSNLKVSAIKRKKPHQNRMKDSGFIRLQNDRSRDHVNWNIKQGIKYFMYTKFQLNTIRQTQVISICGSANQRRESKNKDGTTKVENMKIGQFLIDHIF